MMLVMRTTVTLDGDVEAVLRVAMRERHLSFKEAVNNALRAGLTPAVQRNQLLHKRYSPWEPSRPFGGTKLSRLLTLLRMKSTVLT